MSLDNEDEKSKSSKNSNRDLNDAKAVLKVIESKTFRFIFWFIIIGILLCFFVQFFKYKTLDFTKAAEIWNVFVGILLGVIATIVSLISLFFSFYNTKQNYDSSYDNLYELMKITSKLEASEKKQEDFLSELHDFDKKMEEKISRLENSVNSSLDSMRQSIDTLKEQGFAKSGSVTSPDWEIKNNDES